MKTRRIVSFVLILSFIVILITSIVLFIVPEGRIAHWANWSCMGLLKEQWSDIHTNSGFLFLFALCFHLYFNWKAITTYLKNRAKKFTFFSKELAIALFIVLACILGTYAQVPPFSSFLQLSEAMKKDAAQEYGEPPYGNAQQSSIEYFTKRIELNTEEAIQRLQNAGYEVENRSQTLGSIAKDNQTTPQQIYLAMLDKDTDSAISTNNKNHLSQSPRSGFGKLTISDLRKQYDFDAAAVLSELRKQNSEITEKMTLKEIALLTGKSPQTVYGQIVSAVEK